MRKVNKVIINIIVISILSGCGYAGKETAVESSDTENSTAEENNYSDQQLAEATKSKVYSNERFKDVTVEKVGPNKYEVQGKAQIFEAQLDWVVEDGHNELLAGTEMADAGAPSWGNFNFTVEVEKKRPNSTLLLILYETSAKDGSRLFELPVVLE